MHNTKLTETVLPTKHITGYGKSFKKALRDLREVAKRQAFQAVTDGFVSYDEYNYKIILGEIVVDVKEQLYVDNPTESNYTISGKLIVRVFQYL